MRIEVFDKAPKYVPAFQEALEILDRVQMHDGRFGYSSQVFKDTKSWPNPGIITGFQLTIRPQQKNVLVSGQPVSHQYVEIFPIRKCFSWMKKIVSWEPDETPIARFHFE